MIRIFVGCASGDDLESQAVLEYGLRKHASQPLTIRWMQLSRDPQNPFYSDGAKGWRTEIWSTPFSGFRWAVPALCGFQGRAIYMDSDVIARADIAELWNQPMPPGVCALAKCGKDTWRFCVTLFDCAAARPHMLDLPGLQSDPNAHRAMIAKFKRARFVQPFRGNWNCIDGEDYASLDDPSIKAIHYSQENTQPHLVHALPRLARDSRPHWFDGAVRPHWRHDLINLFEAELAAAKAAGFAPENYAPAQPFGRYRIASHAAYSGHRWSKQGARAHA